MKYVICFNIILHTTAGEYGNNYASRLFTNNNIILELSVKLSKLTRHRPKRGQKWPQARKTCSALWWEQIKISPFRWKSDFMSTMWGFKQNFSNRKCVAMVTPEWQWGHFWPHFGRACNTFSEIVINDIFYISGTVIDRNVIPNLFLIFFGSRKSSRL